MSVGVIIMIFCIVKLGCLHFENQARIQDSLDNLNSHKGPQ